VRTLLAKDLRILARSPLLLSLLVLYPVVVALLIGLTLSRGPEKPAVAFLNQVPRDQSLEIGGEKLRLGITGDQIADRVDVVEVSSREEAERKVRDGDALGAIIVPGDALQKLESTLDQPTLEVIVNEEDPLKGRLVDDTITAAVAEANRRVSRALTRANLRYLELLVEGGTVNVLGDQITVLGLRRIGEAVEAARRKLPRGSRERRQLDEVVRFNRLARENFGLTTRALAAISEPIKVDKEVIGGARVPLTTFAAAVAVAISLMFVTVLLASGGLALERQENTFERLVRGPVSRTGLLAEKGLFALTGSVPLTLIMLAVVSAFVAVEWDRFPLWLLGIAAGAAAFAAMGTLIGALAREVQAASLLAFTLLLPVAFLALVPSGAVSSAVYDVIRVVSAVFPFDPTVDAMTSALYGEGDMLAPVLHLMALTIAFGVAARVAIRRYG
jgi:ABC-type transport system involved in cytochrome c biogenesis permease component